MTAHAVCNQPKAKRWICLVAVFVQLALKPRMGVSGELSAGDVQEDSLSGCACQAAGLVHLLELALPDKQEQRKSECVGDAK